jgi:phage terminase large subunit-like protein
MTIEGAQLKPKATRGKKKKPLMGAVEPRIHTPYLKGESRVDELIEFCEKIGRELMPWQKHVLRDMLQVDKDGKWRRKTIALCISRQNGKTFLAQSMILGHLFLWGSKNVIGMSSNRNMALDVFRDIAMIIEGNDFLKEQVAKIRFANGTEVIQLKSGARYEIVAATRDGSRGKHADFLYVDELREVSEEAWTAVRPLTRATQGVTMTTSNAGDNFSTVLNELRERALSYPSPTLGWYEYSAPDFCKIDDRAAWALANPALGHTITEETLEEAVATNSVEATMTEMLCRWVSALNSPWPIGVIEDTSDSDLKLSPGPTTVFAFDVSPSRRSGALVIGQLLEDGKVGMGLAQIWTSDVGIDDLVMAREINDWAIKYRPRVIMYDKYATENIAEKLKNSGQVLEDCSGQKFYTSCQQLLDMFINNRLVHSGQKELVAHLNNCAAKENDAGWRIIRRKSAGDVTGAIGLAMLAHAFSKPLNTPKIFLD